jgi:type I restriction enzyme M protein
LFSELAQEKRRRKNNFILGDLAAVLTHIEQSTMGAESETILETYLLIWI